MAIESAVLVRRFARIACLGLLVGLVWSSAAPAQLPVKAPVVVAGSVVPFGHGSTGPWSQIYSIKFAPNGNLLFLDSAISNLYQLAPGSSTPTLVVAGAPNGGPSNCATLEASGTYWNAAIAFDSQNNLYVTDRYGSAVHFCRVPYDPTSNTWVFGAADNWKGPTTTQNGVESAISPQDITVGDDGTFYVSWSTQGEIDKFTVDGSGNVTTVTPIVTGLQTMVSNIAVDHAGNLFFIENAYASPGSRVTGIREIPANAKFPLKGDSTGSLESGFTRLDPTAEGLNGIKGMAFDAAGNMFVSLANNSSYGGNVNGVLMVPNEGTPTNPNLVWMDNVMVSPVYTGFPVAIDPRGYLWIPTGGGGNNWAPPGSLSAPCVTTTNATTNATCTSSSIVLWALGGAALGAFPVGKAGGTQTIYYSWSQPLTFPIIAVASPGNKNFTLLPTNPNGDPNANPPVPPCTAGTAYPGFAGQETGPTQYSWCTATVQLNAQAAGSVEGELQLLDASNNVIAGSNVYLSGTGQGPNIAVLSPAAQVSVASGLSQPNQVAGDPWGNSYVADSALKSIEMYAAGSSSVVGAAIGTGLSAPTGVAVDGAGDLFIGDSGKVIEIPYVNGALATKQQTALATGLGNHLNLAADAQGDVYVADADMAQVLRIPNPGAGVILQNRPLLSLAVSGGWKSPSAITTDNAGNAYVADGGSLWEITPWGGSTELTSSLASPVTGLAVDPSGSVFVAGATGLVWIPFDTTTGGLNVNGTVTVAPTVGSGTAVPFSVALDGMENTFVTYGSGAGAGLAQLGVAGSLNWGQIVPFLQSDQEAQIFNIGNTPLTLSAFAGDTFAGANAADYSIGTPVDSPACDPANPTATGTSCFFDVALTPSAAGTSSASLTVLSNAVNAPSLMLSLVANAVPDNREPTTTSIAITPPSGSAYPGSASIAVTVSSSAGTPTGNAVLSVSGQAKQTQALVNGVATFSYTNLLGGTYNVSADYGGSGTAGSSPYPSCATGTPCFAVSAAKASFTINTAAPTVAVGPPTGSATNVTVWAGNTYVSIAKPDTITATVTSTVGTPTGSVSFVQNGKPVDPTQAAIPLDANGNAVFSTANLPAGVYNLSVVYNGDTNYSVITVPIPSFEVIQPSVQVTASPDTTSITPGTPDKVTLTLKPLVGFVQQVDVQCVAASLPSYSECTFDNPEIGVGTSQIDPTTPSTIVVTISTNVPVNGSTSSIRGGPAPWSLAAFFGLGLAGLIAGRRKFHRYLMLACLGLMLSGAFLGLTACTNAGYSTPPPAPKVATPAGTYAIQIITVNPANGQQNSLTTPLFTLQATVQ